MTRLALSQLSNNLVYAAMAVYALAFFAYAVALANSLRARQLAVAPAETRVLVASDGSPVSEPVTATDTAEPATPEPGNRAAGIAFSLTVLAFVLHAGSVLARGLSAGRVPWGNMYEFVLAGTVAVTAVYLVLARRARLTYLGAVLVPLVLLGLGLGVAVLYTDSSELVPALHSYWLIIHVSTMAFSFGVFSVGAVLSLLSLVRGSDTGRMRWLPSAERLDNLSYGLHVFAFPVYTFAVLAGAVWAENAWGRYWGWDPKETWAFIVWVVYAAYLHARVTAGWRGRGAAAIALLGYVCFVFNLLGVNLWITDGLHTYK